MSRKPRSTPKAPPDPREQFVPVQGGAQAMEIPNVGAVVRDKGGLCFIPNCAVTPVLPGKLYRLQSG